ncbi:hypothetical protein [Candidatus Paracaedibacter symbiosus]|uniref:hypothetical protein n=1 Tax=Candidatus Paracaedibacter symbiosus TaxID=244582 RepID=UPI00050949FE|nr:hypothetical protein [Candidatus Paracaedibacter symbiosus]
MIDDQTEILAMPGLAGFTKAITYQKRGLAKLELSHYLEAIDDFTLALDTEGNTSITKAKTLKYRAFARTQLSCYKEALKDYKEIFNIDSDLSPLFLSEIHTACAKIYQLIAAERQPLFYSGEKGGSDATALRAH